MFHCMFSMTFKLVQPQFVPIYTVGLFQLRAMASSSPTTSIPIQEPVFLQFLHDVHHAYLLLHRAMALLPPTLIPNIEPTPLPSTDVWNQPEGLRPIYSDQTNAFIDAVHLPSPDHADEEALMDDLLEPNLPEPHQHVAAPPPDALPDPSKLSTTASTPPKRKQKAKATPKAPAKRRRLHEQSRSRSPSPLTNWTADEKQKLRTLKSDEKSRFSWRVISTKMGKSEADVRSMWNKLKDTLGWVPEVCKRKKGFTAETFHHLRKAVYVSPFHVANVYFHPLTTLLPLSHPLLHRWPPWTFWIFIVHMPSAILLCLSAFTWIDIVSSEPWPATTSRPPDDHALRPEHLLPLWVPHRFIVHRAGHLHLPHPIDRSSCNWIWNLWQQLAARNPYFNILAPKVAGNLSTETYDSLFQTFKVIYPDYARSHFVSDLKTVVTDTILQRWSIHLQATDFYMMIDTDQGAQMLDDLPHSLLDILNWYYPYWKTHQHLDAFTSRECSPLVLTPHPDPHDTGFAVQIQVIPRGHPFVTATRSTKTAAWISRHTAANPEKKWKQERSWNYSCLSLENHGYQFSTCWLPVSLSFTKVTSSSWGSSQTLFWTSIPVFFGFRLLSNLYLFLHYMANHTADGLPRMLPAPYSMSSTNTIGPSLQSDDPTSASYIPRAARMIPTSTTVHTIFIKKITYPFTSRPDELWILERTEDGRETWKPVETFLENMHLTRDRATLRTTANQWRQYYDIPVHSSSSQHHFRFFHILNIPTSMSHNHLRPYRINYTFSNLAGDALLNITHKVQLHLYLGHHGDLHHHPHHQQHFTEPFTRTPLLHLYIILIDQYHLTNRALWICLTPACNAPLRFATVKKTDYMGFYWVFNVVQFLLQLFSRYSSPPFGNFLTMQLGLNFLSSTPWLLLLVLIHIALHLRWTHLKALELLHGLLDTEAFLATGTLLHPDPSWSWWITPLYKNWHIAVNLIMPYTVLSPIQISETLVLENLKLFSPGHVSLNQSKQAFSHCIDNEITHPMGYSHGTLWPGISLRWSSRRCFPSTNRLDHHATFGWIPTWMAHPAVQLHRIDLARTWYFTAFHTATSLP